MLRLFCHCLFLIFPSFDASERLCFVIVVFPGYLHLYFYVLCNVYHSLFALPLGVTQLELLIYLQRAVIGPPAILMGR